VGLDPGLNETESTQCFVCQSPLTEAEQADVRFVHGVSCPYCFKTSEEQMQLNIEARHAAILAFTTPLPGSSPYENERPLNVPEAMDGVTLIDMLSGIFPHMAREEWLMRCERGRFLNEKREPIAATHLVHAGERYYQLMPQTVEPDVNADIRLLHEDEAIIVLHKPAPLPMHPCGRFNRNTLQFILHHVYEPQKPRPAHRLDANTTGLVVLSRTRHFAGELQPQFARGEVEKVYLVRVQGNPQWDEHTCDLPISDAPSGLGSREVDEEEGLESRTEFRVLQRDEDGTTLMEARPLTGRTNQIRVHLWELGFPICGDSTYLPNKQMGDTQTLTIQAEPLCLHAWRLSFTHPMTKQRVSFETERPAWA
jgi:RluA family pseudouridine synthase